MNRPSLLERCAKSWLERAAAWLACAVCVALPAIAEANPVSGGVPAHAEKGVYPLRYHPGTIDTLTGLLKTHLPLLRWSLRAGMRCDLVLHHNPAGSRAGAAGRGWSTSFDVIVESGLPHGDIQVHLGDGTVLRFVRNVDGTWLAPPGVPAELTREASEWILATRDGQTFRFPATGNRLSFCREISDNHGNSMHFERDRFGRLVRAHDNTERWVRFEHIDQRLERISCSSGQGWALAYDTGGNLVRIGMRSPEFPGREPVRTFSYGTNGNLTVATDETGAAHRFGYDAAARLIRITDPTGASDQIQYGTNTCRWIDPTGATTQLEYDRGNRLVRQIDPLGHAWRTTWDDENRPLACFDPTGNAIRFSYDGAGGIARHTLEDGRHWERFQSPDGRTTTIASPSGLRWVWQRDPQSGLETETDPGGRIRKWKRDPSGQIVAYTSPAGREWRFGYDGFGNPNARIGPEGSREEALATSFGDILSIDASGRDTERYENDHAGRVTAVLDSTGAGWRWKRDAAGRISECGDSVGGTWGLVRDTVGRIVEHRDPLGNRFRSEFDRMGRLTKVIDAMGRITRTNWNERGEQREIRHPDGTLESFQWDSRGHLVSRTDGRGTTTRWDIDAAGRVVSIRYSDATPSVFFVYDADDRLSAMRDGTGTTRYRWREDGRLLRRESISGTMDWEMDADGLPLSARVATRGVSPWSLRWEWNDAGLCTRMTLPDGRSSTYGYDEAGRVVRRTDADGGGTRWEYDARTGQPTTLDLLGPKGALRERLTFSYDALGRLVRESSSRGFSRQWEVDQAGRIVREVANGSSRRVLEYRWDPSGSRIGRAVDGRWETAQLDAAGRPVRAGQLEITWDGAGNAVRIHDTAQGRTWNLLWDAESRLIGWTGVRDSRLIRDGFGTTIVIQPGSGHIEARQPAPRGDGSWLHDGRTVRFVGPDGPMSQWLPDPSASMRSIANLPGLAGDTAWIGETRVESDAFGGADGRATAGYRTAWGYESIEGIELLQIGNRVYSPALGIFLSRDPLAAGFHWYAYADDDPINGVDPSGLETLVFHPGRLVPTRQGGRTPGRLVLLDDDGRVIRSWDANSGGYRSPESSVEPGSPTRLPQGRYRVEWPRRRSKAGMVRDGFGFSFNLEPVFPTRRTHLRIHPDGGRPGTEGCVGVVGERPVLENFYRTVSDLVRRGSLELIAW